MNTEQKVLLFMYLGYLIYAIYGLISVKLVIQPKTQAFKNNLELLDFLKQSRFEGQWILQNLQSTYLQNQMGASKANIIQISQFDYDEYFDIKLQQNLYLNLYLMDPQFNDEHYLRIIHPIKLINITNYELQRISGQDQLKNNVFNFQNFNDLSQTFNLTLNGSLKFNEQFILSVTPSINKELTQNNNDLQKIIGEYNQLFQLLFNTTNLTESLNFTNNLLQNQTTVINSTQFMTQKNLLSIQVKDQNESGLNLEIILHLQQRNMDLQGILYSLFFMTVAFIHCWGAINLCQQIYEDVNVTQKFNQTTILTSCFQNCFIFMLNIQIGFTYLDTINYIFLIMTYFCLFCFTDYRLLLYVWRYQNNRAFANINENQFRNKLYMFQLKVYFFLIVYMYGMWVYFLDWKLLLLNSAILIPQIIYNIQNPAQPQFDFNFLILFGSSEYLLFWYLRGCPLNIVGIKFFHLYPLIGFGIILVSLIIIKYQEQYGGSSVLPKFLKKGLYDYFVLRKQILSKQYGADNVTLNRSIEEQVCCICLVLLSQNPQITKEKQQQPLIKNKFLRRLAKEKQNEYLMQTPCDHLFHAECLIQWMEVKMECPTCRSALPPIL